MGRSGPGRERTPGPVSYYNIRDRLGHWVRPRSDQGGRCPHACCNGKRSHPSHLPVIFSKPYLKSLSEPDLVAELGQYSEFTDTHPKAFGQIVAEMDRREKAGKAAVRRKERYQSKVGEYRDEVYRQTLQAEAQTNGYMLNRLGERAGIDPVTLFTGPENRVRKYASTELLNWFAEHGRPTRISWMGTAYQRREHLAASRIY